MAVSKLTEKAIQAAKPGKGVTRLRDGSTPGFHVVVSPGGNKTFTLAFTSPEVRKGDQKARRFIKIGQWSPVKGEGISLTRARREANALRDLIDNDHIDPLEEERRDQEKQAARNQGSLKALLDLLLARLKDEGKDRTRAYVDEMVKRAIPADTLARPAASITEDDIMDLMEAAVARAKRKGRGGERSGDVLRSYLHNAFKFGRMARNHPKWKTKAQAFAGLENPVQYVGRYQPSPTRADRVLTAEEVCTLWNTTGPEVMHMWAAIAVKLLLCTGQRVEELLQAPWSEFDIKGKRWTIPAERRKTRSKVQTREPHLVPLSKAAVRLLNALTELSGDSPWLFPRADGKGPRERYALSNAVKLWCRKHSFKHFSPRDLRRTWKTLAGEARLSKEIRDRIQGHALSDISSLHYDRYEYWDEKRRAMDRWAAWLDTVVRDDRKVVPLSSRGGAA